MEGSVRAYANGVLAFLAAVRDPQHFRSHSAHCVRGATPWDLESFPACCRPGQFRPGRVFASAKTSQPPPSMRQVRVAVLAAAGLPSGRPGTFARCCSVARSARRDAVPVSIRKWIRRRNAVAVGTWS